MLNDPRVQRFKRPDGSHQTIVKAAPDRSNANLDSMVSEELDRKILTTKKSANEIALEIGCCRRTVQRHVKSLRDRGLLV